MHRGWLTVNPCPPAFQLLYIYSQPNKGKYDNVRHKDVNSRWSVVVTKCWPSAWPVTPKVMCRGSQCGKPMSLSRTEAHYTTTRIGFFLNVNIGVGIHGKQTGRKDWLWALNNIIVWSKDGVQQNVKDKGLKGAHIKKRSRTILINFSTNGCALFQPVRHNGTEKCLRP